MFDWRKRALSPVLDLAAIIALFENAVHEWVAEPGPQTDTAREVAKDFVARQLDA